jgi:hypothetical protein
MPKTKLSAIGGWLAAGGSAVAIISSLPFCLKWLDSQHEAPVPPAANLSSNVLIVSRLGQDAYDVQSQQESISKLQSDATGARSAEKYGGPPSCEIDPQRVYRALERFNPEEGEQAIETVIRHATTLYRFNAVYKRIVELTAADDPLVAERARQARYRLMALRIAHEIPEPMELDTNPYKTRARAVGAAESQDLVEPALEPFDNLLELALDDPDPAVRLNGIEAAISQNDEDAFELLREAALGDEDPDNRLSAVNELEQMLKSGLGGSGQIRQLLKEAAMDPDARVAELSQLILHEQNGFHDEKPDAAEIEPTQWEDGMGEPADGSETRMESFETIQQQALNDADPAIRLTGIEASIDHWGKEGFRVLSEAAIGDFDADNRLSAISVLEHILKSGLGDSQQIQELLRYASTDPDPRVAELSSLIIQELAK